VRLDCSQDEADRVRGLLESELGEVKAQARRAFDTPFPEDLKEREALVVGLIRELGIAARPGPRPVRA